VRLTKNHKVDFTGKVGR